MSNKITQEQLKRVLSYDPETGVFTWLISAGTVKAGKVAGSANIDRGYRNIKLRGLMYRASRLAWFYMEGYWPEYTIDHINRIKDDNRWENLRHVTQRCNVRNSKTRNDNRCGITGLHFHKGKQKWVAGITISGKTISLGNFKSKTDAARARWNAEVKHGFPNCNTTSSAYLYLNKTAAGVERA